jgi:hypothetical protein
VSAVPRTLACIGLVATGCYSGSSAPGPGSQFTHDNTSMATPPERAPVALAVLFSGNEVWLGNEEHEKDPNATYHGAFHDLSGAFSHGLPATAFPDGSLATLISYGQRATVRYPMGPVRDLDARAFGVERDYRMDLGNQLMLGIDRAIGELEAVRARKRVLVVIGDGNDVNNQLAVTHFHDLQPDLDRDRIDAYAVVVKSTLSPDEQIISALTPQVDLLSSPSEIPRSLATIWDRL